MTDITIQSRLEATKGRPTGFDYMRIGLAILILCWHSIVTCYGSDVQQRVHESWANPFVSTLLPLFFSLSGFLVAGSLERTKTTGLFLGLRIIRIFPALAVEALVSALILGPMLTTLPLAEYASHPLFHRYFLNLLGEPQFLLPGVFEGDPVNHVNGQLWTIPWELACYAVLAGLAVLGAVRRRVLVALGMLAVVAAEVLSLAIRYPQHLPQTAALMPGMLLVASFLGGVVLYLYRDRLVWNHAIGFASLVLGIGLLAVPFGRYVAVFPLSYATVWLGLMNPRKVALLKGADYSYGVFLYSFALQQTLMSFGPWARHWWLNIALCLPAALLVSALSWRFVEKPALALRKPLGQIEAAWLAWRSPRRVASATAAAE